MGGIFSLEGIQSKYVEDESDYRKGDLIVITADGIHSISRADESVVKAVKGPLDVSKIKESGIKKEKQIGSGNFGVVYIGTFNGRKVAIKELKSKKPIDFKAIKKEADIMRGLKHKNVVELIEVWTETNNFVIVMEYLENGDLQKYLVSNTSIDQEQMKKFAIDIAEGMQYLESKNIIHRDLAARNVLLDKVLTAKVSDFGLARLLDSENSVYASSGGPIPIRWTALEGLLHNNFSTKSDVWSYGIVLVEIVTRGEVPYPDLSNDALERKLQRGYRHPQPRKCSDDLYRLMMSCWDSDPSERPNFSKIAKKLKDVNF